MRSIEHGRAQCIGFQALFHRMAFSSDVLVFLISRKFEITRERVVNKRNKLDQRKKRGNVLTSGTSPFERLWNHNARPVTVQITALQYVLHAITFTFIASCVASLGDILRSNTIEYCTLKRSTICHFCETVAFPLRRCARSCPLNDVSTQ